MSVLQKNNSLPFPPSFNYLFHFRTMEVKRRQLHSVPSLLPLSHALSWKDFYIYRSVVFPCPPDPLLIISAKIKNSKLSKSSRMSC